MSKKYIKNFDALRTPGNDIVFSCRLTVMRQQENCKAAESLIPWEHLSFPFGILERGVEGQGGQKPMTELGVLRAHPPHTEMSPWSLLLSDKGNQI